MVSLFWFPPIKPDVFVFTIVVKFINFYVKFCVLFVCNSVFDYLLIRH